MIAELGWQGFLASLKNVRADPEHTFTESFLGSLDCTDGGGDRQSSQELMARRIKFLLSLSSSITF